MRRTFWLGVFANRVESELSLIDLESLDDMPERGRALVPNAYVRIQRLGDRRAARRAEAKMREILAEAPDEPWNLEESDYVVFVWETLDTRRLPVGFATFSVSIFDDDEPRTKASDRPIDNVIFYYQLAFVRPDKRGIGFGRHLSQGILEWMSHCRLAPPRCASGGVDVHYHADFDSEGGEVCSGVVTGYFEYLQDQRRGPESDPSLPWHIANFTEDSGY